MKYILEKQEILDLKKKLLADIGEFFKKLLEKRQFHDPYRTGEVQIDLSEARFRKMVEELHDDLDKTINNL